MAEPAHSAAGPGPDGDPERKPDPRASGWGDVRAMVTLEARAIRLAAEDVRRAAEAARRAVEVTGTAEDPGDLGAVVEELRRAVQMEGVTVSVMQRAVTIAGRCQAEEALIKAEHARGFDEGVAACRAARCRLEVLDGGGEG